MPADTDGSWRTLTEVKFRPGEIRDKRGRNPIPDNRGLFVIHAVHLFTGKVLWFCGHAEQLDYPLEAYLFDPRNPTAPAVRKPFPGNADLFCCHYVQLADGRILVVGGSQADHLAGATFNPDTDYRGSAGASTIAIFDPRPGKSGERWEPADPKRKLLQGRWYPTAVILGDGSVLVISGRREAPEATGAGAWSEAKFGDWLRNFAIADIVEHLRPPTFKPQAVTGANRPIPIYPGIHLAPDDRLYFTNTTWGQEVLPRPPTLSLTVQPPPTGAAAGTAATGAWTEYVLPTAKAKQPEREEGMSVMLPVVLDPIHKVRDQASVGKFLVVGGGFAVDAADVSLVRREVRTPTPPFTVTTPAGQGPQFYDQQKIATPEPVEILDTSLEGAPRWTAVPGLTHPRINGHCVLLPDATVLILGGHDAYKWNAKANSAAATAHAVPVTNPTLPVEIYTPGVGFHVGAPMARPRMYHSIAMLLADGSVIVAGGADPNEHEPSLPFPLTWNGRLYAGTARVVLDETAGTSTLQIDPTPSSYWGPLTGFTEMPAGTKVIIDPGPAQIETTVVALRVQPGANSTLQFLDIATPLPRAIATGTRVDFAPAAAGTAIPRVNEWITTPLIDRKEAFSTPLNRKDYEVYQPPYFHKAGTRPVLPPLKPGQVQVSYGTTFTVATPDAARITRVAIMRPACVTHHTDTEQRFVELEFTPAGTTGLSIKMVPATDSSLVPPGYYMLWILAGALPCVEARFIQVTGAPKLRSPAVPTEVAPPSTPPTPPTDGGGGDGGGGGGDEPICPLAMVATTALALAQVTYLRQLRAELAASPGGGRFVALVNRAYDAVGTPLARQLAVRARWQAAVRAVVLGPLAAAITGAERLARRRRDGELRRGRLIALLTLVGATGAIAGPLVAGAAAVHVTAQITHARVTAHVRGRGRRWPNPAPSNA